jgi:transposase
VTLPPPLGFLKEGSDAVAGGVHHAAPSAVVRSGATPLTELATAYGISRKTAYKWVARYEAGGLPALADQSRRPVTSPTATPPELIRALLEARAHHPT